MLGTGQTMLAYTAKRFTSSLPAIVGIVTLVFLMIRLLPGDPAAFIGGDNMGAEALAGLRERLGLNKPLPLQYVDYIGGLLRFDLGRSLHTNIPITSLIGGAIPLTILVALSSVVLGTAMAVPLGAMAAYSRSRGRAAVDQSLTAVALIIDTMPGFWLALVFILVFSLNLGWFPVSGPVNWSNPGYMMQRLALPIAVLSIGQIASVARVTRTSVLQTLSEDYVRTARAMGASEMTILFRFALPNAALPIVTITGLSVGRLFGGTVITESIFSLPGMGTELINGIFGRDYPVIQGLILTYSLVFVAVNLLTDVLYTRLDPRVRLG